MILRSTAKCSANWPGLNTRISRKMNEAFRRQGEKLAAEITAATDQRRAELAEMIANILDQPQGPMFIQSIGLQLCEMSPQVMRNMSDTELKLVSAMAELALRELCAGDLQRRIELAGG